MPIRKERENAGKMTLPGRGIVGKAGVPVLFYIPLSTC